MSGKSRILKTLSTIVVTFVFATLLVATSLPAPKVDQYLMEDTIRWGDLSVKVLGMERANEYQDLEPKTDREFIVVTVQFKNTKSYYSRFPDDPDQFYLEEDGTTYAPIDMVIGKNNPYVHRFEAEEEARGTTSI